MKPRRSDTDDRARLAVDAHGPAKHTGRAFESAAPQPVTDDRHRIIRRLRDPADDRHHTQIAEKIGRHPLDLPGRLHDPVDGDDGTIQLIEIDNLRKHVIVRADVVERQR